MKRRFPKVIAIFSRVLPTSPCWVPTSNRRQARPRLLYPVTTSGGDTKKGLGLGLGLALWELPPKGAVGPGSTAAEQTAEHHLQRATYSSGPSQASVSPGSQRLQHAFSL